jgi:hypothetical protein
MQQDSPTLEEHPLLDRAVVQNPEHATLREFYCACQSSNADLALQLPSDQKPAALTVGLNLAIRSLSLEIADRLLSNGVQWDTETMSYASKSLNTIQLLLDFGFDVTTVRITGGTLLG